MTKIRLEQLKNTVLISCQAREGDPFDAPHFITEFAKAAVKAGASGLRINSAANIAAVRQITDIPIIGINKRRVKGFDVFITPSLEDVKSVIEAGADIIGLDGTTRLRPGGDSLDELVSYCHEMGKLVFADIATESDAKYALKSGADILATTLSGHTRETSGRTLPDLELVEKLSSAYGVPVVLEGGIAEPCQVKRAFQAGAYAVVVGKAVTMPHIIAEKFIAMGRVKADSL